MSDFADMIKEALTGGPAFEPEPGRKALENAMQRYDKRARSMRALTAVMLVFMTGVTAWGLMQLVQADAEDTRMIAHGAFLATVGVVGIGFAKLWFLLAQNHLMVMRELKGLEYLALRGEGE